MWGSNFSALETKPKGKPAIWGCLHPTREEPAGKPPIWGSPPQLNHSHDSFILEDRKPWLTGKGNIKNRFILENLVGCPARWNPCFVGDISIDTGFVKKPFIILGDSPWFSRIGLRRSQRKIQSPLAYWSWKDCYP